MTLMFLSTVIIRSLMKWHLLSEKLIILVAGFSKLPFFETVVDDEFIGKFFLGFWWIYAGDGKAVG